MIITNENLAELISIYRALASNTYLPKSVQWSHRKILSCLEELKKHRTTLAI